MSKKLTLTLVSAVVMFSVGTAYAAQGKSQGKSEKSDQSRAMATTAAAEQSTQPRIIRQPIPKSEALQSGVTEEQFARVDKNGDGALDAQEVSANVAAADTSQSQSGSESQPRGQSRSDSQSQSDKPSKAGRQSQPGGPSEFGSQSQPDSQSQQKGQK